MKYDIHCHLTSKEYADPSEILDECGKRKIAIVLNGLGYEDNLKVLALAKKFKNAYASLGMHPSNDFDSRVINQIIEHKDSIIAIGEIGLDFKSGFDESQIINFKKLIKLANDLKKPIIVHSRMAEQRLINELISIKVPVILHCFTGKKSLINEALKNPLINFSIPASIHYSEQFQDLAKEVPIERILCETDSPYLWKTGLNSPLNVTKAYESIAKIKGLSLIDCEALIEKNFEGIFKNH